MEGKKHESFWKLTNIKRFDRLGFEFSSKHQKMSSSLLKEQSDYFVSLVVFQ